MKTVNASYGIDSIPAEEIKAKKWYYWHRFPLLPIFEYRPGDKWNSPNFSLSWLNFRIHSMMSPDIGFEFMLEDIGMYIRLRVPYLILTVWLLGFPYSWHQKLWRIPKTRYEPAED